MYCVGRRGASVGALWSRTKWAMSGLMNTPLVLGTCAMMKHKNNECEAVQKLRLDIQWCSLRDELEVAQWFPGKATKKEEWVSALLDAKGSIKHRAVGLKAHTSPLNLTIQQVAATANVNWQRSDWSERKQFASLRDVSLYRGWNISVNNNRWMTKPLGSTLV